MGCNTWFPHLTEDCLRGKCRLRGEGSLQRVLFVQPLSLLPSHTHGVWKGSCCGNGHTESWKLKSIHPKLVVPVVKLMVGLINKDDEEDSKEKAYSFLLLDFETLSSTSDHSPEEEERLVP